MRGILAQRRCVLAAFVDELRRQGAVRRGRRPYENQFRGLMTKTDHSGAKLRLPGVVWLVRVTISRLCYEVPREGR